MSATQDNKTATLTGAEVVASAGHSVSSAPTVDGKKPYTSNETEEAPSSTSSAASENQKSGKNRWFQWHEPGTSTAEKRLIFKLDWFLLSISCLLFFIKQLDANNISNAYVSGMADDLGFGPGNELSWMNTYFSIGVILGGCCSNLLLTVIRPRYWLPGMLFAWSLLVLGLYKCNHAYQFYILRFFIGFFESSAWPGVMYVLGCWYRKSELARRSGLFVMSGVLGQMFSGYLQSALYTGMHGKGGLAAWRWLFIFDFLLAIPVVIYGVTCYPDTPETTQAWYLNEWERKRACERIAEEGRTPVGKLDWTVIRRIFLSWQVYAFTAAYSFWTLTCGSYIIQYFTLYLRADGRYSVPEINNIPTSIGAVNFVFMLSTGYISDKIGRRGPVCLAVGLLLTMVYSMLTGWSIPHQARMAAFILVGCYGCYTPLLAGWANEACAADQQKRAFILAFMVSVGQAVVIPFQQLQLPSGQAPEFKQTHGWPSALSFVIALTLWTGVGIPLMERFYGTKKRSTALGEQEIDA